MPLCDKASCKASSLPQTAVARMDFALQMCVLHVKHNKVMLAFVHCQEQRLHPLHVGNFNI